MLRSATLIWAWVELSAWWSTLHASWLQLDIQCALDVPKRAPCLHAAYRSSDDVNAQWQVDVYTAHHDRNRCFQETVDGPFSVTVCGSWFPRAVLNRMHAFCAYVRCMLIAAYIAWVALRQGTLMHA